MATLAAISKEQKAEVEPVHVLDFSLQKEEFKVEQAQVSHLRNAAKKAAEDSLKDVKGIKLLPPHVIMIQDSSPKGRAQALVEYANETHALFIVAGTHARHGLPRLFLGSFAETVILHSDIPVITICPECLAPTSHHDIFSH